MVFPVVFYVDYIRYIAFQVRMVMNNKVRNIWRHRVMTFNVIAYLRGGARGSVVVEALCYKPEGSGISSR
jgi:hypothetical protein